MMRCSPGVVKVTGKLAVDVVVPAVSPTGFVTEVDDDVNAAWVVASYNVTVPVGAAVAVLDLPGPTVIERVVESPSVTGRDALTERCPRKASN